MKMRCIQSCLLGAAAAALPACSSPVAIVERRGPPTLESWIVKTKNDKVISRAADPPSGNTNMLRHSTLREKRQLPPLELEILALGEQPSSWIARSRYNQSVESLIEIIYDKRSRLSQGMSQATTKTCCLLALTKAE